MLIALIAHDKTDSIKVRMANRADHLAYVDATGVVSQAGPILDGNGEMCGSLIILDLPDMAAAQDWADNDPYAKAGLFGKVDLIQWKKVFG